MKARPRHQVLQSHAIIHTMKHAKLGYLIHTMSCQEADDDDDDDE